jgi:hypothetical protein
MKPMPAYSKQSSCRRKPGPSRFAGAEIELWVKAFTGVTDMVVFVTNRFKRLAP